MKTPKTLLLLLVGAFLLFSCGEHTNNQDGDHHDDDKPTVGTVAEPNIIISVEDADALFKNYGVDRADKLEVVVNQTNDLEEPYIATRFVTVDYATLQQYMNFINQESKKAGVTPEGLRFYFGQEKSPVSSDKETFGAGRETIFVNPVTTFKGINGQISYAILPDGSGNYSAVTVGSVIDSDDPKNPQKGANLLLKRDGVQSLAGDTFGYPPPPVPGDPNDYH